MYKKQNSPQAGEGSHGLPDRQPDPPKSLEEKAEALRKVFGIQIKDAREARGYTQAQLASMTGMTKNHLSALERGKAVARHDKLLELSEILDIDFTISARNSGRTRGRL